MPVPRSVIIASVATIALLSAGAAAYILSHAGDSASPLVNAADLEEGSSAREPASLRPSSDPDSDPLRVLQGPTSDDDRIRALDDFGRQPSARSTNQALRSAMVADASPKVRVKAFQVARELAAAEGRDALISVLRDGIHNPNAEVRRDSLRSCRTHPHYELMEELMQTVREGGRERPIAIQALAVLDDPEAQRAVLDAAKSETLPRPEKIQAIALLCESDLPEASEYLQALATGEDAELKAYALEALVIRQANHKR